MYNLSKKNYKKEKGHTLIYTELYLRFFYYIATFFLSFFSCWVYGKEILYLYLYPLLCLSQNIIFTSISEAFTTTFTVCLFFCLCSAFPFLVYLVFCFFSPSLFPNEKKKALHISLFICVFFCTSLLACNLIIIPELCNWFLDYGMSTAFLPLSLEAKISSYISWSIKMYTFSILILQIPICFWAFFFKDKNFYGFSFFSKNRKYFYCCILGFCAIISPPDLYMQSVLFFFSVFLFEFLLWYGFLKETLGSARQICRKKKKKIKP